MKVIDLLNKIANGEEIPKEMCIQGDLFFKNYGTTSTYEILKFLYEFDVKLNDEVEILEEEKKIPEKLNWKPKESMAGELTQKERIEVIARRTEKLKKEFNNLLDYLKSKGE